ETLSSYCRSQFEYTVIFTLSLHDALPIYRGDRVRGDRYHWHRQLSRGERGNDVRDAGAAGGPFRVHEADSSTKAGVDASPRWWRSEEHTSELQSRGHLVCRLPLEKKKRTR